MEVVERARDDARVQLHDAHVARVGGDVQGRGQDAGAVPEPYDAQRRQQVQPPAAVAGIVRDADARSPRQVRHRLGLARIQPDGGHDRVGDGHDPVAPFLDLVVEVGPVLEGVGVQVAAVQRLVRQQVVGERRHLQPETARLRLVRDALHQDLGIPGHDADPQRVLGARRPGRGSQGRKRRQDGAAANLDYVSL